MSKRTRFYHVLPTSIHFTSSKIVALLTCLLPWQLPSVKTANLSLLPGGSMHLMTWYNDVQSWFSCLSALIFWTIFAGLHHSTPSSSPQSCFLPSPKGFDPKIATNVLCVHLYPSMFPKELNQWQCQGVIEHIKTSKSISKRLRFSRRMSKRLETALHKRRYPNS